MAKGKKKFAPPKGTRDFMPEEMRARRRVMNVLRETFESFGYGELDTPAFESFEMLAEKSGAEVENQIYAFDDKGGRRLGLRFEFTASLARVVASNPNLRMPFRRYQMGKVWRYENPQAGRYREFYQADVDIIGSDSMACEAELISIFHSVCQKLKLQNYRVVFNHRKILTTHLELLHEPKEKHSIIFRALDKLHKIGLDGVEAELIENGYEPDEAEAILENITLANLRQRKFVKGQGLNYELPWKNKLLDNKFKKSSGGQRALDEMKEMYDMAIAAGVPKEYLLYDPALVRGLDYYTGPVFEFQTIEETGVGSFGGGGRYDNLVEAFGGPPKPAVGFAFGVDRLVHVYLAQNPESAAMPPADVYVIPEGTEAVNHAMALAAELREAGVTALVAVDPRKTKKEFQFAGKEGFPFAVFVTEQEAAQGKAQLRELKQDGESQSETLPLGEIRDRLAKWAAEK